MKTALIHDWLVTSGGAEKVLEEIWNLYPSPIFTLMNGKILPGKKVISSVLQKMPGSLRFHRYFLPFFPWAIEKFDLNEYEVLISSSHAVAKGIKKREDQLHICYCHTPMRYAWDLEKQYMENLGTVQKWGAKAVLKYLREWDLSSSNRVDYFIANSNYVAERIERIYGRKATVIYPPVLTEQFYLSEKKEEFYLTVSRLVPYKKIELIVEAFASLPERQLVVVGDGPEMNRLKAMATPNVKMMGLQTDEVVSSLLSRARAFIFAAEEDFGIVPVEAQASGTPVIAFGKGGACETVIAGKTGIFFEEQAVTSLVGAIHNFEMLDFDPQQIKAHAETFNKERFRQEFRIFVEQKWGEFCENRYSSRR
jgi:glycosyltransferase involved in cell wall biosynthesis